MVHLEEGRQKDHQKVLEQGTLLLEGQQCDRSERQVVAPELSEESTLCNVVSINGYIMFMQEH